MYTANIASKLLLSAIADIRCWQANEVNFFSTVRRQAVEKFALFLYFNYSKIYRYCVFSKHFLLIFATVTIYIPALQTHFVQCIPIVFRLWYNKNLSPPVMLQVSRSVIQRGWNWEKMFATFTPPLPLPYLAGLQPHLETFMWEKLGEGGNKDFFSLILMPKLKTQKNIYISVIVSSDKH